MKRTKRHPACRPTITAVVASAFVLLVSGCDQAPEEPEEYVVKGPMAVSYGVQTSETTKISQSGTFSELRVKDGCVILVSEDGKGGTVVPLSKVTNLTWRKN